ncbi:MAG: hypothetical protein JSW65_03075 [Candidatus Bipolaricaulota bacterium]|nr:MAG: hypothetical protein JSW65_03075 [Candidatus Bipolaricaulota bacterium]
MIGTSEHGLEPQPEGEEASRPPRRRAWWIVFVAVVAATGGLVGFITGSDYGDIYASTFRLAGLHGHQATRLIGLLIGAASAALACAATALIFRRQRSVSLFVSAGAIIGILLTEPLLFPLLPPHHGFLPLAYLGAAIVGALVAGVVGGLSARRR